MIEFFFTIVGLHGKYFAVCFCTVPITVACVHSLKWVNEPIVNLCISKGMLKLCHQGHELAVQFLQAFHAQ